MDIFEIQISNYFESKIFDNDRLIFDESLSHWLVKFRNVVAQIKMVFINLGSKLDHLNVKKHSESEFLISFKNHI